MKKHKLGIGAVIAILAVIIACFGGIVSFVTNLLWFDELGYISVFLKKLTAELELGIPIFLILTALSYLYLQAIKKGYYKRVEIKDKSFPSERTVNLVALGLSALFGAAVAIITVTRLWFEILQFANATDFGLKDPIFNLDIGFYIFRLSFATYINQIILGVVVAFIGLTLIFYVLLMGMRKPQVFEHKVNPASEFSDDEERFTGNFTSGFGKAFDKAVGGKVKGFSNLGGSRVDSENLKNLFSIASRQLIILGVVFFLMVGTNFFLKQFTLLYSNTGVLYGAGFTDINITLWVYRILIALSVLAAIFFVIGIKQKSLKKTLAVPVIMIIVAVAGTGTAALVQNLVVAPDEISKEYKYLKNNIAYTQSAYDLQGIKTQTFAASNSLTKEDIVNNAGTFSNIRINDYEPTSKFYNQAQSIRTYYEFNDVDVDRYMINGEYTQTFLSAREIDESKIAGYPWLSKHLKYTHGYGITLSRVDKVTESGQPDLLIDSIPPVSDVEEIDITRPEIYFGENTSNYVITNTDEKEFDYPEGDSNVYCTYEGDAGIHLNLLNRLLFAFQEHSLKLLVSNNIDSDSKILINRNIMDRVQKIAPFLEYDKDPYIVTVDGKLYWMLDAYTYSSYYPYSEPYSSESSVNYIRNSVKVVIDAYNGDTDFYIVESDDPIAQTLKRIYPKLFKDLDQMPEELQKHMRYPNALFAIQAQIYTKYHMNNVEVFYQKEDMWAIAKEVYGMEETTMTPSYYIMKLPGEDDVEFINSIPYTPNSKNNMTGLLVARNDGEHYGEMILYQLPKSKITYGPRQIESQIDQETTISKEFSLWNSSGSSYTRGNMFVIPVEDSLIYVEPIYLEASNSSLPEVKRVIVYYNERIAYEPTLGEALDVMFGEGAGKPLNVGGTGTGGEPSGGTAELSVDELIVLANETYEKATAAQKSGDWAAYGEYLKQLERYLKKLMPADAYTEAEQENAIGADIL